MFTRTLALCFFLSSTALLYADDAVEGAFLGPSFSSTILGTAISTNAHYWGEHFGAGIDFSYNQARIEINDVLTINQKTLGLGITGLAGVGIAERLKLFMPVTLDYSWSDTPLYKVKRNSASVGLGVGIEFLASEHLALGLTPFFVSTLVSGAVKDPQASVDVKGIQLGVGSRANVSYRF